MGRLSQARGDSKCVMDGAAAAQLLRDLQPVIEASSSRPGSTGKRKSHNRGGRSSHRRQEKKRQLAREASMVASAAAAGAAETFGWFASPASALSGAPLSAAPTDVLPVGWWSVGDRRADARGLNVSACLPLEPEEEGTRVGKSVE